MKESLIMQALEGTNERIPVWLMRQAGRFLPEYQAIRRDHPLEEMFLTPEIAAHVTCLPIDILGVDAAILFADILTLPSFMGMAIRFDPKQGPIVDNPITQPGDLQRLHAFEDIPHIRHTIGLVKDKLPAHIPLIGFAGAPFTVLCYLLKDGLAGQFKKVLWLAEQHPQAYRQLMEMLTSETIRYFQLQKKAGIQIFQLFDTWGGILRERDYREWVLPYVQHIFTQVDVPSIYYLKNTHHLLVAALDCPADVLSVCSTVDIATDPRLENIVQGIQGNFSQALFYADYPRIEAELQILLAGAERFKTYIFNLSHGVFPDIEVDKVKFVVEKVHAFPWRRH
jgi:uroporphyrinogen decarboxylase